MIDRKAIWISGLTVIVMGAAALWRLSLLPDWHHVPIGRADQHHAVSGLGLLIEPGALLAVTVMLFARKWFISGPEPSLQRWRRWSSGMLLGFAALAALTQAFILARSFGLLSEADTGTLANVFLVLTGVLLMGLGNLLPKLPWLSVRFRPFRLDPWQSNRQLRLMGKLLVGMGLFVALVCPWLPHRMMLPALMAVWLAAMAANIGHRIKLRREAPPDEKIQA